VTGGVDTIRVPRTDREDRCRDLVELGGALRDVLDSLATTEIDAESLRTATAFAQQLNDVLARRSRQLGEVASADEPGTICRLFNPAAGQAHPFAPVHDFREPDAHTLESRCVFGPSHEGPLTFVHGGVTALMLDQLFGAASSAFGDPAMTASLHIDYRRPVPLGEEILFRCQTVKRDGRKRWLSAQVWPSSEQDRVLVEAEALMITPTSKQRFAMYAHVDPELRGRMAAGSQSEMGTD
jgi:acyl-coenzyme A thioesterase PaaI-like protein